MTSARKVALVTGATAGIGRSVAQALVEARFTVVGTGRSTAQVPASTNLTFVDLDVTDDTSVASAVAQVIARHGRIDLLVNNAGIGSSGAAEESSIDQTQQMYDVNVFGLMRVTNAVLPSMRAQGSGRVVNMSSIVGIMPQPYMSIYASTKFAVEGYSESLDHELREFGVRSLLVEPAWTSTTFETNALQADRPLTAYQDRREGFQEYMVGAVRDGDAPSAVAAQVVAAATDARPRLRYPVGRTAGVATMRRLVPTRLFDRQLRKINNLPN